jgi:hypothetical protein
VNQESNLEIPLNEHSNHEAVAVDKHKKDDPYHEGDKPTRNTFGLGQNTGDNYSDN